MSSNIGVLQTEYASNELNPICRYALSFDKAGIRMEIVMGLAMILILKAAVGSL